MSVAIQTLGLEMRVFPVRRPVRPLGNTAPALARGLQLFTNAALAINRVAMTELHMPSQAAEIAAIVNNALQSVMIRLLGIETELPVFAMSEVGEPSAPTADLASLVAGTEHIILGGGKGGDGKSLEARFDALVTKAEAAGFRVDGVALAKHLLSEEMLAKIESTMFSDEALEAMKPYATRIEFVSKALPEPGTMPLETMLQIPGEAVFRQIVDPSACTKCTRCINICPKDVLVDDGFGRPTLAEFQAEVVDGKVLPVETLRARKERLIDVLDKQADCTGPTNCGKCMDVCATDAIVVQQVPQTPFAATIFAMLPEPAKREIGPKLFDFFIDTPNPIFQPGQNVLADGTGFYPIIEIGGKRQHLIDSLDRNADLIAWARENNRHPALVAQAIELLMANVGKMEKLPQGSYEAAVIIDRVINEMILSEQTENLDLLREIVDAAHIAARFEGARNRPIGGQLPPGTSIDWHTPYAVEVPQYGDIASCLLEECGLCATTCAEGSGGPVSAIKLRIKVPAHVLASRKMGLGTYTLDLETATSTADIENLTEAAIETLAEWSVDLDYCKGCGLCYTVCPKGPGSIIEMISREVAANANRKKGGAA